MRIALLPITFSVSTACWVGSLYIFLTVVTGAAASPPALPRYETTDCDFDADYRRKIECGTLTVLENRLSGSKRVITLPVVVFRRESEHKAGDPVVYLSGGPGQANVYSSQHLLTNWPDWVADSDWLQGRDLIIFDPRGTGMARPSLDCPEERKKAEEHKLFEVPFVLHQACANKLKQAGIDISAYHTPALAADLHDLRRAMGIDNWSLWASSYGTRVAFEAIRQDETGIRSVILDGISLPRADDLVANARNYDRIIRDLIASCPLNSLCKEYGTDLPEIFHNLLRDLRDNPRELSILSPYSYKTRRYMIDDRAFLKLLFHLVYHYEGLRNFPFVVLIAHQGRLDFAPIQFSEIAGMSPYRSIGAATAITCNDQPTFDQERFAKSIELFPYLEPWAASLSDEYVCRAWTDSLEPALDPGMVESDIPTLLLAGAFDPTTPVSDAYEAANHLDRSHLFVFPGWGHGVIRSPCAQKIMKTFLANPLIRPSAPCFAQELPPSPG